MRASELRLAQEWANGGGNWDGKQYSSLSVHYKGPEFYSYDTVIAVRMTGKDGSPVFVFDKYYYTNMTVRHQYLALRNAPKDAQSVSFPIFHCLHESRIDNNDNFIYDLVWAFEGEAMYALKDIEKSMSISIEKAFESVLGLWNSIVRLHGLLCDTPLADIVPACYPVARYMCSHEHADTGQAAMIVVGEEKYLRYFARTMTSRKAECTRKGIAFEMPKISKKILKRASEELATHRAKYAKGKSVA